MPIQFSCAKCNHELTVADRFAGKAGKCPKCGSALQVPDTSAAPVAASAKVATSKATPAKAAARPNASPGMLNALDDLTETDFSRRSPFEAVYTPPKRETISDELVRRVAEKDGRPVENKPPRPIIQTLLICLVFFYVFCTALSLAVLSFPDTFSGIFDSIGLARMSEIARNLNENVNYMDAMIAMGVALAVQLVVVAALANNQKWGYFASATYFFAMVVLTIVLMGFTGPNLAQAINLLVYLVCSPYFFTSTCRSYYAIKNWTLPIVCVVFGLLAPVLLFAIGMLVTGLSASDGSTN